MTLTLKGSLLTHTNVTWKIGTRSVYRWEMEFAPIQILKNKTAETLSEEWLIPSNHLPFTFSITAKHNFGMWAREYEYPATGITIHLERNTLGALIGQFYIPTGIFSLLSLISYFINPSSVCFNEDFTH